MLKIVYRICCGLDVHKSFVVACIASTNEQGVTTYNSKRFPTFAGDLRKCAASSFRTKGMRATNEQVLAAVDGEMCAQQAEKLRIIRSHMNSLELCKLHLESDYCYRQDAAHRNLQYAQEE